MVIWYETMIQLLHANGIKNIPVPGHGILNLKDLAEQSKLSIIIQVNTYKDFDDLMD